MAKALAFCCAILFPALLCAESDFAEPSAFVVMNALSGRVLLQRAAHKKMYPASTTKVATALYVLKTPGLDLNQKLVVPQEAVKSVSIGERAKDHYSKHPSYFLETGVSSLAGLKAGEVITIQDALYGALLCSGNDAANVLAYYWGKGSIEACVEGINRYVESLGCIDTRFYNPHGLYHPQHMSTAYDLALIARQGMAFPLFRRIVGSKSYTKERTNKQQPVTWQQTNKLLLPGSTFCEQATGIKTGYLSQSKHCLVASAENKDRSLIAVLLGCQDRKKMFHTAKSLLEKFLSEEQLRRVVVEKGPLKLSREVEGQPEPLPLSAKTSSTVGFFSSEEPRIRAVAEWSDLTFPIEEGQEVGVLRVLVDEREVDRVPLLASERREQTWTQRLLLCQHFVRDHQGWTTAFSLCIIAFGVYVRKRFTKRRRL